MEIRSESVNVFSLQAFQAADGRKLYALTFVERSYAGGKDSRLLDEDFPASVAEDDSVALRIIEPLDASLFHTHGS